jgi:hypothetical protein
MRTLSFCLVAACLGLSGCEWLKRNKTVDAQNPPPLKDRADGVPTADRLVGYLNKQADRMSVIETNDVSLLAHVQGRRMPELNGGIMVCEKPRSFRLTGDAVGMQYLDIGSNGEQFWFWVKDGESPLYYCSYNDYEKGVKMPLPFQPEWVVQALGMAKYDPTKQYKVEAKPANRVESKPATYELVENTTVQGLPVRKITIFNANNVTDPKQPQVMGHKIQDAQGKTICEATIKHMRYASYKSPEGETSVAYPSEVVLEWPSQQLKMTMRIGKATVNNKLTIEDATRYFSLPNWQGLKTVDLARLSPVGNPTSRDVRQTGGYRQ